MYDFIIFCVTQNKKIVKKKLKKWTKDKKLFFDYEERYCDYWKCISRQRGVWLNVMLSKDEIGGTNLCKPKDLDEILDVTEIGFCNLKQCTPFEIQKEYQTYMKEVLTSLIELSLAGLIYVLARYQSEEKEIMLGTYTVDKYFELMKAGNIYSNVCYVLTNNKNAI